VQLGGGYRIARLLKPNYSKRNDARTLVMLAFSGGGDTRAAALSYGEAVDRLRELGGRLLRESTKTQELLRQVEAPRLPALTVPGR
jgi:hypothetical protein